MTIINLRGPNGSGKSTVAHDIIKKYAAEQIPLVEYINKGGGEKTVLGYYIKALDLTIVGSYNTACGGCDGIPTQELICAAVEVAAKKSRNVFFEGVIVSTIYGRYKELSEKQHGDFIWAFLDTPLETCLARIQARNGGKQINEDLVSAKVRAIAATERKAAEAGERCALINHKRATQDVLGLLETS